MRKILTIALAITMCAGAAMATHVGLYGDEAGTDCTINPTPGGLTSVYVVQKINPGSTAVKFMINDLTGMLKGGQSPATGYLTIGDWYTGIEVAFACVIGDHKVGTLNYIWFGQALTCANSMQVVAAPGSSIPGSIISVDCTMPFGQVHPASGGRAFFGPQADTCGGCDEPLAVEEKTWGSIKALYR